MQLAIWWGRGVAMGEELFCYSMQSNPGCQTLGSWLGWVLTSSDLFELFVWYLVPVNFFVRERYRHLSLTKNKQLDFSTWMARKFVILVGRQIEITLRIVDKQKKKHPTMFSLFPVPIFPNLWEKRHDTSHARAHLNCLLLTHLTTGTPPQQTYRHWRFVRG